MSAESAGLPPTATDCPSPILASVFRAPERPLKAVSVADLEREFALALQRLTGVDYTVELDMMEFERGFAAALFDRAELTLQVRRTADPV